MAKHLQEGRNVNSVVGKEGLEVHVCRQFRHGTDPCWPGSVGRLDTCTPGTNEVAVAVEEPSHTTAADSFQSHLPVSQGAVTVGGHHTEESSSVHGRESCLFGGHWVEDSPFRAYAFQMD